jgi:hypothetical protein
LIFRQQRRTALFKAATRLCNHNAHCIEPFLNDCANQVTGSRDAVKI